MKFFNSLNRWPSRVVRIILASIIMSASPLFASETVSEKSEISSRLVELLSRQNKNNKGELGSIVTASIDQCVIKLVLDRGNHNCTNETSYWRSVTFIDPRILETSIENAEITDHSGTNFEGLGASIRYRFERQYDLQLTTAGKLEAQILEEERERFGADVAARLESLATRYRAEIDISLYERAQEVATFCSGTVIRTPLSGFSFNFYVEPGSAQEFADLLDRHTRQCDGAYSAAASFSEAFYHRIK